MRHDDFTHSHPHLCQLYSGTDLAARLIYEERLRQGSLAYQASLSDAPARSRVPLVARIGRLLMGWGKWLQATGSAMAPTTAACSLDTQTR